MKTNKNFSISKLFLGGHIFFNFEKERIEYGIYDHKRTDAHFETEEIAKDIFKKIFQEEQLKAWGFAKSVTLWEGDKKIDFK